MGNLGSTLGELIGGGVNPAASLAKFGGLDGGPALAGGMFNPNAAAPGTPVGLNPVPPLGQEEALLVEGFKPTKRNVLGRLADAMLMANGGKPVYEGRMAERDMKRAMQGFSSDPMEAVRKISTFDPDAAFKLYNMVTDNQRSDESQKRLVRDSDRRYNEGVYDRGISMLATADEKSYPAMKSRVEGYFKARGVEMPFPLPDVYDAQAIEQLRMGEVPVARQLALQSQDEYRDRSLDIREERVGVQNEGTRNQMETRTGALEERRRSNLSREQIARERPAAGGKGKPAEADGMKLKTPRGTMETNPEGNIGRIKTPEGFQIWKKTPDGKQWKRVN